MCSVGHAARSIIGETLFNQPLVPVATQLMGAMGMWSVDRVSSLSRIWIHGRREMGLVCPGATPIVAFNPQNGMGRHARRLITAASAGSQDVSLEGVSSEPSYLYNASQAPLWRSSADFPIPEQNLECTCHLCVHEARFLAALHSQLESQRVVVCGAYLTAMSGWELHEYARQRHWHDNATSTMRFISLPAASYVIPSQDIGAFNQLAEAPKLNVYGVPHIEEVFLPKSFHHRQSCHIATFPPVRTFDYFGRVSFDAHYTRAMETSMSSWITSRAAPTEPILVMDDALPYLGLHATTPNPDVVMYLPTGGSNRYYHPCNLSDPFLGAFASLFHPITPAGQSIEKALQRHVWSSWRRASSRGLEGSHMWISPLDTSLARMAALAYRELVLPLVDAWVREEAVTKGMPVEENTSALRIALFDVRALYVILGGRRLIESWSPDRPDQQRVLYTGGATFDSFPLHNLAPIAKGEVPPVSPIWSLSDTAYSFFLNSSVSTVSWFEPHTGALLRHIPHKLP